jgi:hypothetical protein
MSGALTHDAHVILPYRRTAGMVMRQADTDNHLIVFFRRRLTMASANGDPGARVVANGKPYVSKVDSDFTGFYDRMYNATGGFLGLQVGLLMAERYLPQVLCQLPYVLPSANPFQVRIFFAGQPTADPRIVDDQGFGGRIYEAIDGEFAMSFDLAWLDDGDRRAIRDASADWVELDLDIKTVGQGD